MVWQDAQPLESGVCRCSGNRNGNIFLLCKFGPRLKDVKLILILATGPGASLEYWDFCCHKSGVLQVFTLILEISNIHSGFTLKRCNQNDQKYTLNLKTLVKTIFNSFDYIFLLSSIFNTKIFWQVEQSVLNIGKFSSVVKLAAFFPFKSAQAALENINAISEGKSLLPQAFRLILGSDVMMCQ